MRYIKAVKGFNRRKKEGDVLFKRYRTILTAAMKAKLSNASVFAFLLAATIEFSFSPARAETPRRINATFSPVYYILDPGYFNMDSAPGIKFSVRYEIKMDIYIENAVGAFMSKSDDVSVNSFNYQFGLLANIPYFFPYRPSGRLGFGFMTADPITVTPQHTFRPSQTTFYFVIGLGMSYPVQNNIFVEAGVDVWLTPYRYIIYKFNRQDVETAEEQFTHVGLAIGASYVF
jgi:hypothetical protein